MYLKILRLEDLTSQRRNRFLATTTMSNRCLPPELPDDIANLLQVSRDALKSYSLVSKSWISRSRTHLFSRIKFHTMKDVESWKTKFSDPSTSPAHCARTVFIECPWITTATDVGEGGLTQTFFRTVHLEVNLRGADAGEF